MRDYRNDPEFLRFYAGVLMREAAVRTRPGDGDFVALLIAGAGRAMREADEIDARTLVQGELFPTHPSAQVAA